MKKTTRSNFKLYPIAATIVLAMLSQLTINLAHAGAGWGDNVDITGAPIKVQTYYANSPSGPRPNVDPNALPTDPAIIDTGTALRKFVDTLPGLGETNANNLGQYIPVAAPEKWVDGNGNLTNDDYYEIAVVEYNERMHSDLAKATRLRGYVQISTAAKPGKHIALTYPNGSLILDNNGAQVYAYDNPHYLGPLINANKGVAVRIKYSNYLPVGGELFIPVDKTIPGAGVGPDGVTMYTENRADIHWHGGDTPWISDGTPHQWIAPAGETAAYAAGMGKGVSAQNVPDMPDPGPGSNTLYFPNNMSGRLMFYHDHTSGLTRLNVYAGVAAGYLLNDPVEQALVTSGTIPADQIPLIIQDKTFVPKDIAQQDAKWSTLHWGQEGDLWFPHVYETNQDPNAFDGTNPVGRWDWGPWFWPIFPAQYSLPSGDYGDVTTTPEAFMDTPVINGTAYPTVTVDPKAYRFRILNASNDRFINLGLYKADMNVVAPTGVAGTEVKMVPAIPSTDPNWPATWPTDGRAGGVPDPFTAGPDIIQIGNEGGLLPNPVVIPSQAISFEQNRRSVTVLNILDSGLYMGPAERADVVIDFSQYAGQTLILFNDSPAPVPAFDPRIDYFTGDGDQTGAGGAGDTQPGYGPNTRTMMQIKVSAATPAALAYNAAALVTALPAAYGASQEMPVVPQAAYNAAFGTNDADNLARIFTGSINQPTFDWTPTKAGQTIASIALVGGGTGYRAAPIVKFNGGVDLTVPGNRVAAATAAFNPVTRMVTGVTLTDSGAGYTAAPVITFTPVNGGIGASATVKTSETISLPVQSKAIVELFDPVFGRMNATLGVELPFTSALIQTTIPLAYIDPATETIADGETQIWKITHNGVDTHPVHFHLVNVQVINRIGWDGTVKPNPDNEMGWKETVKMNPLEDIVVAVRAKHPLVPFGLPQSIRAMDPSQPLGSTLGFTQVNVLNNLPKLVTNQIVNYDNEYVWHCHILGHEENDFMRPFVFHPNGTYPNGTYTNGVANTVTASGVVMPDAPSNLREAGGLLTWTDPTPAGGVDSLGAPTLGNPKNEISFGVQKSSNGGAFTTVAKTLANATSWNDPAWVEGDAYRVIANNVLGDTLASNTVYVPAVPTNLVATTVTPTSVALTWGNSGVHEDGFGMYRNGYLITPVQLAANVRSYVDDTVAENTTYVYEVKSFNASGGLSSSSMLSLTTPFSVPLAPTTLTASLTPVAGQRASVSLNWADNAFNEVNYIVSRDSIVIATLAANTTSYVDATAAEGATYSYQVAAVNVAGTTASAVVSIAAPITAPLAPTLTASLTPVAGQRASVTLSWIDNAFNEDSYTVTRDGVAIATLLAANTTSYVDATAAEGATYSYAVEAVNTAGTGSTVVSIAAPISVPLAPTTLAASLTPVAGQRASVSLSWVDVAFNEVSYTVTRDGVVIATLAVNTASYVDATAAEGATYSYAVEAVNTAGAGSTVVSIAAPISVPLAPTTLAASLTPVAGQRASVSLSWVDVAFNEVSYTVSRDGVVIATLAANATSYVDASAAEGSTYSYQVAAVNPAGTTASAAVSIASPTTAPLAPTALTATANIVGEAVRTNLSWADNAFNETGYVVQRQDGASCNAGGTWNTLASLAANSNNYVDMTAVSGASYCYQVSVVNSVGSVASNMSAVAMPIVVVAPTMSPVVYASTGKQVTLSWTDNANNETSYVIEAATNGGAFSTLTTLARSAAESAAIGGAVSYNAVTVPGNRYSYRVTALNLTAGLTTASFPVTVVADLSPPAAPAAPTAITTYQSSATSVLITWTDNANNETGYRVEVSTNGGATFTKLAEWSRTAAQSTSTGGRVGFNATVAAGNIYTYRVSAFTTALGSTTYSAYVGSVSVDMVVPAAPTALTATPAVTGKQVTLSWTDNANNETRYLVEVATNGGAYSTLTTIARSATESSSVGGVVNYNAVTVPGNIYSYRMSAIKVKDAVTTPSASIAVVADLSAPVAPTAPTGLITKIVSSTSVQLTWTDNANNETGYRVEVSTDGGVTFSKQAEWTRTAAQSTSTGGLVGYFATVVTGNTYTYRVKAFNTNLGSTTYSAVAGPVSAIP